MNTQNSSLPFSEVDYRQVLRREFEHRRDRNSQYSLRAFARDISLSPSRLVTILQGREGLSRRSAISVGSRLGYTGEGLHYFSDLVESVHARSKVKREAARQRMMRYFGSLEFNQVKLDQFALIADWYHFAIVELATLPDFESSAEWIASYLGLTVDDTQEAIERLFRLGLLCEEGERWLPSDEYLSVEGETPSEAIRLFHSQIMTRGTQSLHTQPINQRHVLSSILTFDSSRMKEAKAWIERFEREFTAEFGTSPRRDRVYCFSVQFFDAAGDGIEVNPFKDVDESSAPSSGTGQKAVHAPSGGS